MTLDPWERFLVLSHSLDEVEAERAGPICKPLATAAMTVVRQVMGRCTRLEAYLAIENARVAIEEARRGMNSPLLPGGGV